MIYQEYGFKDLEKALEKTLGQRMDLSMLWSKIWNGGDVDLFDLIIKYITDNTIGELKRDQELFGWYLQFILFSLLSGFLIQVFQKEEIRRVVTLVFSLFFTMMSLVTIKRGAVICQESLEILFSLSEAGIPVYLLTMSLAQNQTKAAVLAQTFSIFLLLVQAFFVSFLCPAGILLTQIGCMDALWMDARGKALREWIQKLLSMLMKGCVYCVTLVGFVQNQILSISVGVERSGIKTLLALIPGVGKLAEESLKLLIGSAGLICRCTGVFLWLVVMVVCAPPFIKLVLIFLVVSGGEALTHFLLETCLQTDAGLMREYHIFEGMHVLTEGIRLMCRILFWAVSFFGLMVAVTVFGMTA